MKVLRPWRKFALPLNERLKKISPQCVYKGGVGWGGVGWDGDGWGGVGASSHVHIPAR